MSYSQYLEVALDAAKDAEKIINTYSLSDLKTELKFDGTPVSKVDKEIEHAIKMRIASTFPDHGFLGEEEGATAATSPYLWIIDPIDGTKNFLRNIPLFATQLALMKDGEVVLGVSNSPALGELLFAEKGGGAFLNEKKIAVSQIANLSESYLSYGSIKYFDRTGLLPSLLELEKNTRGHRGYGEFWSYHLLAQGKIDIMIEAETKIWDVAALSLIVTEAGGMVTTASGAPFDIHAKSMIASNGLLHEEVLNFFK